MLWLLPGYLLIERGMETDKSMALETIVTEPGGKQYRLKCPDCGSTEILDGFICMECAREIHGEWKRELVEESKEEA